MFIQTFDAKSSELWGMKSLHTIPYKRGRNKIISTKNPLIRFAIHIRQQTILSSIWILLSYFRQCRAFLLNFSFFTAYK